MAGLLLRRFGLRHDGPREAGKGHPPEEQRGVRADGQVEEVLQARFRGAPLGQRRVGGAPLRGEQPDARRPWTPKPRGLVLVDHLVQQVGGDDAQGGVLRGAHHLLEKVRRLAKAGDPLGLLRLEEGAGDVPDHE